MLDVRTTLPKPNTVECRVSHSHRRSSAALWSVSFSICRGLRSRIHAAPWWVTLSICLFRIAHSWPFICATMPSSVKRTEAGLCNMYKKFGGDGVYFCILYMLTDRHTVMLVTISRSSTGRTGNRFKQNNKKLSAVGLYLYTVSWKRSPTFFVVTWYVSLYFSNFWQEWLFGRK